MASATALLDTTRSEIVKRLRDSLADVLHAVDIAPSHWLTRRPSDEVDLAWLGGWSIAENVAHLAVYEERIAAPILESIAAGRDGAEEVASAIESEYESLWKALSHAPMPTIMERLSIARSRQLDAIASMNERQFHAIGTSLWRQDLRVAGHSAAWVATKTFQHTWEHGNSIFRIVLFAPR